MVECRLVCVTRVWGASKALAEATINIARRGIVVIVECCRGLCTALRTGCALRALLGLGYYVFGRVPLRLGCSAL